MRSLLHAALLTVGIAVQLHAGSPSIHGRVVDSTGLPLPGVTVTLRASDGGAQTTTSTDAEGLFALDAVAPGEYDLDAALDGFAPVQRPHVLIGPDEAATVDLKLAPATVREDVTVVAPASPDVIGDAEPNAPVTVTREVMDVAMLPNSQFDDVLSLMPNVLRGPDGIIAVAGARAETSGLFVNGLNVSNPIGGGAGLVLPLEAVDSMQVYAGGAPAEFGRATGGITSVHTRSGSDQFHVSVDSFFPRLLYGDSGVSSVAFWDPNVGLTGPLVRGRVSFQEALSYRFDRNTFTTLEGPDHNTYDALLTWTQLDARLSSSQHLRVSFAADPRTTDHANVTAFTPSSVSPAIDQGGWSAGVAESVTAGRALIEIHASALDTGVHVTPSGDAPYVMSHALTSGSYFDRQDRQATAVEAGTTLTWSPTARSVLTAGVALARAGLTQTVEGGTIDMLRSDGSLARTITFLPASSSAPVESSSVALFVQDQWTPRSWATLNAGIRYDETTNAGDPLPSPRVGWSLSRDHGLTTIAGSAGLFSDALPLNALAFPGIPARRMIGFAADGTQVSANTFVNTLAPGLHVPQAARWDLQLNRTLGRWTVRTRYEERRGRHELIVEPAVESGVGLDSADSTATVSSVGTSRARSVELTSGFRANGGNEFFVSYVRASTWGDANNLETIDGLLRTPFLQPDTEGPLPIDVPHRLLTWGVFRLPGRLTVAPFLDMRSGFPFTAIDDAWVMSGQPNASRLPWMASLDLSATRIVGLPRHLPDARVGLKLYNIVSAHTEREVQRDVERPDFGATYDPVPRDFSFVFELLWGRSHANGQSSTRSNPH